MKISVCRQHMMTFKSEAALLLGLFSAEQAHCICAQGLCSSSVTHLYREDTHHESPQLALGETKGNRLFPAVWIPAQQRYEGNALILL